jgi:RND family efflux transporter MFP subunit
MRKGKVPFWVVLALAPMTVVAQTDATPVGVDEVVMEPMSQTLPLIGRLVSLQTGVVAARTAGPVDELRVEVGDHVEKGQILVVLDQSRLRAYRAQRQSQVEEQQARKSTAIAKEKLARQELARLEKLRDSAAFARSLYDSRVKELAEARSSLIESDARIASGEVALQLADIELRDSEIRAPFPGAVTLKHVSEGAWVGVGDPVVTLVNDSDLEIEAEVPAAYIATLKVAQKVEFLLDRQTRRVATVRAIIPDENPTARTRPVRFSADLSGSDLALAANQPVTLLLPSGLSEEVVTVHKDAVIRQGGQAIVYVVEEGVANPRPLSLGKAVGSRFQVLEGLRGGELVVVKGNERLQPGQAVMILDRAS